MGNVSRIEMLLGVEDVEGGGRGFIEVRHKTSGGQLGEPTTYVGGIVDTRAEAEAFGREIVDRIAKETGLRKTVDVPVGPVGALA